MAVHELSRADARRIAVRAQLLDAPRPTDLLDVVRRPSLLQDDQTRAVAPSADLMLWSRLGQECQPAHLRDPLADGTLVALRGMIRPSEDLALYRADMAEWPGTGDVAEWKLDQRDWFDDNDVCRRDIIARLETSGPLTSRDIPRHVCGSVAIDGVERQPQRTPDARDHGEARRGRGRWSPRPGPALAPGVAGLPRHRRRAGRRGSPDA